VIKEAQARGDLAVSPPALRAHLGTDVTAGLTTLGSAIREALDR